MFKIQSCVIHKNTCHTNKILVHTSPMENALFSIITDITRCLNFCDKCFINFLAVLWVPLVFKERICSFKLVLSMITSLDSSKKISFLPFFTKDSKIKKKNFTVP